MEKPQFDHQNSSVSSYGDLTDFQMEDTASSHFSHERNNHQAERFPSLEKPRFDHQNSSRQQLWQPLSQSNLSKDQRHHHLTDSALTRTTSK
ncbi:unnamed protein product [Microthlaspi erraticum]|uniref:Uncharacterized protein n=1 Tax=Microthlaspi erraticum TaxID=1685480 RepID=A0A6D2KT78_9BRAS|nr:unnamed protein product [Microthlaspi erraticum]